MDNSSIFRLPKVLEMTGLSRTTVWRYVKAGTFPAPLKLGPRAVGWLANPTGGARGRGPPPPQPPPPETLKRSTAIKQCWLPALFLWGIIRLS